MTPAQEIHALVTQLRNLQQRFIRLNRDVHAQQAATYARDLLSGPIWRQPERVEMVRGWADTLRREADRLEERRAA